MANTYFSKIKGIFFLIIFEMVVFQLIIVGNVNASPLVHQIAGDTRYNTAADIAEEGWNQSDTAVLAYGENFSDALLAVPLAKKYNAPILFTEQKGLTSVTRKTLQDLKVKNVFIVGGSAVISSEVEAELKAMEINVTRVAGEDKYDTAIKIAELLGSVQEIVVVSENDYSAALSIACVTATGNAPIFLVPKDHLPDTIKNYLSSNKISHTFLIEDSDQIDESVINQFSNIEKITGNNKYEGNIAVLKRFDTNFDFSTVFLATGNNFPDALAGSVYAARKNAPLLLVDSVYNNIIAGYINSKIDLVKQFAILGGEAVIPSVLIQKYTNQSNDLTDPDFVYSSREVAEIVSPSVVSIATFDSDGDLLGLGSGFIIDANGEVATNYHVIDGASSIEVITYDGKIYDVTNTCDSDSLDLALIKIDACDLKPVVLGDSDKAAAGDKIYTLGNPLGLYNTISDGLISAQKRVIDGCDYIQISAPISPGSSGGVLVNEHAEVIGITCSGMTEGQNLNFAIPINNLKAMLSLSQSVSLNSIITEY